MFPFFLLTKPNFRATSISLGKNFLTNVAWVVFKLITLIATWSAPSFPVPIADRFLKMDWVEKIPNFLWRYRSRVFIETYSTHIGKRWKQNPIRGTISHRFVVWILFLQFALGLAKNRLLVTWQTPERRVYGPYNLVNLYDRFWIEIYFTCNIWISD